MKKSMIVNIVFVGSLGLTAVSALAEQSIGATVLEREATRARELQDLKYQAKLIEQRAKIAKAYQEFKDSGGLMPGDVGTPNMNMRSEKTNHQVVGGGSNNSQGDRFELPMLKQVNGNKASFNTSFGHVEAKEGGFLPGGYRVLAVSSVEGVKLEKDGIVYQVGLSWN